MRVLCFTVFFLFLSAICNCQVAHELWGMTQNGGDGSGLVFKTDSIGNNYQVVYKFPVVNPFSNPQNTKFVFATNGKMYATTCDGGSSGTGAIIEYDTLTHTLSKKADFVAGTGGSPFGELAPASNGKMYGLTSIYGLNEGTLFEFDPATNIITKLVVFNGTNGGQPFAGGIIQANNGKLYGATFYGGTTNDGVLFEYDLTSHTYTKKVDFSGTNGSHPSGSLYKSQSGKLYGLTSTGGTNNHGCMFEYDPVANTNIVKYNFSINTGSIPHGGLIQSSSGILYGLTTQGGVNNIGVLYSIDTTGSYSKIKDLDTLIGGRSPYGSLCESTNGKLYGMSSMGGINNYGELFEYNPLTDSLVNRFDFDFINGSTPLGSLALVGNGKLYGLTSNGGITNSGTFFAYNTVDSTLSKLMDFKLASLMGDSPLGSLMQSTSGKIFGLTSAGGLYNKGVLFEMDQASGVYTKKFDFDSTHGSNPQSELMQANNGKFYGTTSNGGAHNQGVIFEYDEPTNNIVVKYSFSSNTSGSNPTGSLLEYSNGVLYGTTVNDGFLQTNGSSGTIYNYNYITNTFHNVYTLPYSYQGFEHPYCHLIKDNNNIMYGTTTAGCPCGSGGIFSYFPSFGFLPTHEFGVLDGKVGCGSPLITRDGKKLFTLTEEGVTSYYNQGVIFYQNMSGSNTSGNIFQFHDTLGAYPMGAMIEAQNNKLYGLTNSGGAGGCGVLFEFNPATNTYTKKHDFNGVDGANPVYTQLLEVCAKNPLLVSSNLPSYSCLWDSLPMHVFVVGDTATYQWYKNNAPISGANLTSYNIPVITKSDSGSYFCEISNGCHIYNSTQAQFIYIHIKITATDTSVCIGNPDKLTAVGASFTYSWTPVITNGTTFYPSVSQTYTVIGADYYGCTDTSSIHITVNTKPIVTITPSVDTLNVNASPIIFTGNPLGGIYLPANSFNPTSAGDYIFSYTYTDSHGCTDSAKSNITVLQTTSINNASNANQINIFPNPSDGRYTIIVPQNNLTIEIFNSSGILMYKELNMPQNLKVDLSDKANGIYEAIIYSNKIKVSQYQLIKQ